MNNFEILENLILYNPVNNKIRLGRKMDGGYVIIDNYSYDFFISAGIGGDISFEIDFMKRYKNIEGVAFDGTIVETPKNLPEKLTFYKKNIATINDNTNSNLDEYLKKYKNIFIKMDIEGKEWGWIKSIHKLLPNVKQIVFEAHHIFREEVLECLKILNKTHYLVHVHENNNVTKLIKINDIIYPSLLELTYIRKNDSEIDGTNSIHLPIENLDYPNIINKLEHNMNVFPFFIKKTTNNKIFEKEAYNIGYANSEKYKKHYRDIPDYFKE